MLRQRLIFTLIYNNGYFSQSRNFRLQNVGDINWLKTFYNFQEISFSLDELVIVDATREGRDITKFAEAINKLANNVFIPISAGGGVKSEEDAEILFKSGADKLVLNTAFYDNHNLFNTLAKRYGRQCLLLSLDYRMQGNNLVFYKNNGQIKVNKSAQDIIARINDSVIGEVYLNSIDRDGTGFGMDLTVLEAFAKSNNVPLIAAGGAGNEGHLCEAISINGVAAVATANLFNFIGEGLPNARKYMIDNGVNLAKW